MTVRVRFAPSPTGDLHIGGVRTALYNYLHAKHEGGTFVLRIEDTDQQRNSGESLKTIKEGLEWCGLGWDEGPYYQSQRRDRYNELARQLEEKGRAYWKEDPEKGKALYFKIDRGPQRFTDLIHGEISQDSSAAPDFVLLKSDGFPSFKFANVIDDHDMGITHVLRGDDHLSNTPSQLMLYRAFGWTPPHYGHMPLIFDPDGEKLSKRKDDKYQKIGLPVSVSECRSMGYLPEAVLNFLALLGWSPGNNIELMTLDEMVKLFTVDRIGTTPARFLVDKLEFMNGHYIRKSPADRIVALCRPYLEKEYGGLAGVPEPVVREAVRQQQERLKRLSEIVPLTRFVFAPAVAYDEKAVQKWLKADGAKSVLQELRAGLAALERFDKEPVEALLKSVAEKRGLKLGKVAQPLRVAVTGGDASPPMHETLGVLGKEKVLARIDATLKML